MGETPIRINASEFDSIPLSKKDASVNTIIAEARGIALERTLSSTCIADFLRYHYGALICTPGRIGWRFAGSPSVTANDLLSDLETPEQIKAFQKEGTLLKKMRAHIENIEKPDPTQAKIALARIRNLGTTSYRVLVVCPPGKIIDDEVLPPKKDAQNIFTYMYCKPHSACVQHACDVLYKQGLKPDPHQAIAISTIPYMDYIETYKAVYEYSNAEHVSPFVINIDQHETQSPQTYVMAAVHRVFDNEWDVTRVSDFWRKAAS